MEDTPPSYPADYFDPGDVKKLQEKITIQTIEDKTWSNGTQSKLVTDVVEVGYDLTIDLGQINQDILTIAHMGTAVGENEIQPLTKPLGIYAIKWTPKYPRGEKWHEHFWKCNLVMSGTVDKITGTYQTITLAASGLIDLENHPMNPWFQEIKETVG